MMKKLLPLLLCLLLLTGCAPKPESLGIFAMDTYMSLVAVGDGAENQCGATGTIEVVSGEIATGDIWQIESCPIVPFHAVSCCCDR